MKALRLLEPTAAGSAFYTSAKSRQQLYHRIASIHHRLASLYHNSYRNQVRLVKTHFLYAKKEQNFRVVEPF